MVSVTIQNWNLIMVIPLSTNPALDSLTKEIFPTSDIREFIPLAISGKFFPLIKKGCLLNKHPLNGITFSYHYER